MLSKPVFRPVLNLYLSLCHACMNVCLHNCRFGCLCHQLPPVFASVCEGKTNMLGPHLMNMHPREEVGGNVLGFDPWAGAHLSFASLVQGDKPVPSVVLAPVNDWGVGVEAVLLKTFSEFTFICENFLQIEEDKDCQKTNQGKANNQQIVEQNYFKMAGKLNCNSYIKQRSLWQC